MLRFSNRAVPVGKVPSIGKALTGRRSPLPSIIIRVTRRMKSGSPSESAWTRSGMPLTAAGIGTSRKAAIAPSTAAKFRSSTTSPRRPYVLAIAFLICSIAFSGGRIPATAKKQVCITVLIRPPSPAWRATLSASTT